MARIENVWLPPESPARMTGLVAAANAPPSSEYSIGFTPDEMPPTVGSEAVNVNVADRLSELTGGWAAIVAIGAAWSIVPLWPVKLPFAALMRTLKLRGL